MRNGLTSRAVLLGTWALLVAAAAPGLSLGDAGDLSTAAFTLGVAPGTGVPLWCLLAKAATLVPLGEVAQRIALLSALCGALAATGVFQLVREVLRGAVDEFVADVAGLTAAGLLVADDTVWGQATVAAASTPTVATLVGMLLLAHRAARGEAHAGLGLALLGGLGLGLQASFRLLVGPPLVLLIAWRLRRGDRWPLLGPLLFALGALVLCYLPVAAARHPAGAAAAAMDAGDPRTLGRLMEHLLHEVHGASPHAVAGPIQSHDLGSILPNGRRFLAQCEAQLGVPALVLAAIGLGWLLLHRRLLGLFLTYLLGSGVLSVAWSPPEGGVGPGDPQYGVPVVLGVAVAAGASVAAVARRLERLGRTEATLGAIEPTSTPMPRRIAAWAMVTALGFVAVIPAALANSEGRFARGHEAAAWSTAALRDVPARALLLVHSEDLAAGTLYLGAVWGLRPDVTVLVRQDLSNAAYLARAVARGGGWALDEREIARWTALSVPERLHRERELLGRLVLRHQSTRPVLWEPGDDAPPAGSGVLVPGVPLYRVASMTKTPQLPDPGLWMTRIDTLLSRSPRQEPLVERLAARALSDLAAVYRRAGDDHAATQLNEAAAASRR